MEENVKKYKNSGEKSISAYLKARTEAVSYLHDREWVLDSRLLMEEHSRPATSRLHEYEAWKESNLSKISGMLDGMNDIDGKIMSIPGIEQAVKERIDYEAGLGLDSTSMIVGNIETDRSIAEGLKKLSSWWMTEMMGRKQLMDQYAEGDTCDTDESGMVIAPEVRDGMNSDRYDSIKQGSRQDENARRYLEWIHMVNITARVVHGERFYKARKMYHASSFDELDLMDDRNSLYSDGNYASLSVNPMSIMHSCKCTSDISPQILLEFEKSDYVDHLLVPQYDVLAGKEPTDIRDPQIIELLYKEETRAYNGSIVPNPTSTTAYVMWKMPGMEASADDFESRYGHMFRVVQFIPKAHS